MIDVLHCRTDNKLSGAVEYRKILIDVDHIWCFQCWHHPNNDNRWTIIKETGQKQRINVCYPAGLVDLSIRCLELFRYFFDATIKQFVSGVSGDGFSTRWQPQVTQCVRTVLLLLLLMFHFMFCCCFSCYTGDDSHQDCVVQEVHDHGWLFP
jgi:hypothetical protein